MSRLGPQQTLTLPSSYYQQVLLLAFPTACVLNCAANTPQLLLSFFFITQTLGFPLLLSQPATPRPPLLSSCQVDISFISQEVFDRSFYEEMYPPAAPVTTAQRRLNNPPRQIRTKIGIFICLIWEARERFPSLRPPVALFISLKSFF